MAPQGILERRCEVRWTVPTPAQPCGGRAAGRPRSAKSLNLRSVNIHPRATKLLAILDGFLEAGFDVLRAFIVFKLGSPSLHGPEQSTHARSERTGLGLYRNCGDPSVGKFVNRGDHFSHVAAQAGHFPNQQSIKSAQGCVLLHALEYRTPTRPHLPRYPLLNVDR